MNIINKILSFIKNIFSDKEKAKELQEPEKPIVPEIKTSFRKSSKETTAEKK